MELEWGLTPEQVEKFKQEYLIGRDAGIRMLSYHQNPHELGSANREAWRQGWVAAVNNRQAGKGKRHDRSNG